MLQSSNNTERVRSCHYMGTRSPFKPTRSHWLFRVTIDFLTKAMTSLISPLVCHLTQMGSLAAGPDNNSSGYESATGWKKNIQYISQQMCIRHCTNGEGRIDPSLDHVRIPTNKRNQHYLCLSTHISGKFHFTIQFPLNRWKMREKSTDRFSAGLQNKNKNEQGIIFPLIRGHKLS